MIIYNSLYRTMKNGALVVMPAPVDKDTPDALWEAERAALKAPHLARYGCGAWLWPPLTMAQGRTANNADGYGKQFDLNFGQWPNQPTRWGTAAKVLEANEVFHAHGMLALEDNVVHQYDGGNRGFYCEIGSTGHIDQNLFPKTPLCFAPRVQADDVFDPEGNYSFGDLVSYLHCVPAGYMLKNIIRAIKARKQRLALDGMRLDDTKGENIHVTTEILDQVGGWNFGECFAGDPNELERWVTQSGGKRTLDFTTHWALQGVCDYGASLRTLQGCGLAGRDPDHAVLFVDTADTDRNDSQNIKFRKLWAYFYVLTIPAAGVLVYAGDYELYGLGALIDNLMWISTVVAVGAIRWEYVDNTLLVWSRNGDGGRLGRSPGVLCGFNSGPGWRNEWVRTPFAPHTRLHDVAGHLPDVWTNADGWIDLAAPPDPTGAAQNYFAYVPTRADGSPFEHTIPITPLPHRPAGSLTDFSDVFPEGEAKHG